ncbi:MAG: cobyric acid synthase [Selenomonadaceae bacterium]|nr:cobyric acid synthase [Selenomonadaceae bacterium]
MANYIMLQGTSSHVGKSILTAALCRILYQEGRRVTPFKAQNMALNSYVTADGLEMGRAQVAQAEAARLAPNVDMNPVLLKPTGNSTSQVIINGRPIGNMSAKEYHQGYSLKAFDAVKAALKRLDSDFDTIVIEGAGSPAEVNLKANDIVNMRVAKYLNAPVLLVADIDRGGSLAALVGTLELLDDDERDLVKGLVINKFRGDVSLFTPAIDFLENKTGKPVLGVVPFIDKLGIDDEDSVSLDDKVNLNTTAAVKVAVVRTPKMSNFTDFDSLAGEQDVSLTYAGRAEELEAVDLVVLSGSKNTIDDLMYLKSSGIASRVRTLALGGTAVIGICGGFQMLGSKIADPLHIESTNDEVDGLGLLPLTTTFAAEKYTRQVTLDKIDFTFLGTRVIADNLSGYEIHSGVTGGLGDEKIVAADNVLGTYVHGIFDNDSFRRQILNAVRLRKGLKALPNTRNYLAEKQQSYDRLAQIVCENLNMTLLKAIMECSD